MNEFESDWISLSQSQSGGRVFLSESERRKQGVWIPQCRSRIQDGGIQDGHYHQVKWEWMSLSQNELVRVRVRVEVECFWVNLRQDNKVSESKMAVAESNIGSFQDVCHHQVNQNELVWVRVRVEGECFWVNLREDSKVSESKMAVSGGKVFISDSERKIQSVWIPWGRNLRWQNSRRPNSRWPPSSS